VHFGQARFTPHSSLGIANQLRILCYGQWLAPSCHRGAGLSKALRIYGNAKVVGALKKPHVLQRVRNKITQLGMLRLRKGVAALQNGA